MRYGRVLWRQYPVGHGGFHAGCAESFFPPLALFWVFDCGSRSRTPLRRELQTWAAETPKEIDWLFISHFDSDHVNGLDDLLRLKRVRSVMLPYVNEEDLAYALCEAVLEPGASWMVDFIADPVRWLGARGVRRIFFLQGGGDESDFRPDGEPRAPEGDAGRPGWKEAIWPRPRLVSGGAQATGEPEVAVIPGGDCQIASSDGFVQLRLEPYRPPVHALHHAFLLARLAGIVGLPPPSSHNGLGAFAKAVAFKARHAKVRKEIQSTYALGVGSSNRASLSLMSTVDVDPLVSLNCALFRGETQTWHGDDPVAWFSTGDAELLDPLDLADWESRYSSDLPRARVLALPHHGSDHNSDGAFQRLNRQALLTAQVSKGALKHPGLLTRTTAGGRLALITQDRDTAVSLVSWFSG